MGCGSSKSTEVVNATEVNGPSKKNISNTDVQSVSSQEERQTESVADRPSAAQGNTVDDQDSLDGPQSQSVAFDVPGETSESLIKKHPPRRLMRLEDQQTNLTHEQLAEKQIEAEKRRQEILTQRVQSARQRSARSAGRMRSKPVVENNELEQVEHGEKIDAGLDSGSENEESTEI